MKLNQMGTKRYHCCSTWSHWFVRNFLIFIISTKKLKLNQH